MVYSFVIFFLTILKCGLILEYVLHLRLSYKIKNIILSVLLYISMSCFAGVMRQEVITYSALAVFTILVLMLSIDSQNRPKVLWISICTYLIVFGLDHFLYGIFNMVRVYMFINLYSDVMAIIISQSLSFIIWCGIFILMHRNQDKYADFFQRRY